MTKDYRISLNLNQDPELVAIRFTPAYNIADLSKMALYAYFEGNESFRIRLAPEKEYIYRPLRFWIHLSSDEKRDKRIIEMLDDMRYPPPVFVKNIMKRFIEGDVGFLYSDTWLRDFASQHERKKGLPNKGNEEEGEQTENRVGSGDGNFDFESIGLEYLKGGIP